MTLEEIKQLKEGDRIRLAAEPEFNLPEEDVQVLEVDAEHEVVVVGDGDEIYEVPYDNILGRA